MFTFLHHQSAISCVLRLKTTTTLPNGLDLKKEIETEVPGFVFAKWLFDHTCVVCFKNLFDIHILPQPVFYFIQLPHSAQVKAMRLIKAQARAVISELKKA